MCGVIGSDTVERDALPRPKTSWRFTAWRTPHNFMITRFTTPKAVARSFSSVEGGETGAAECIETGSMSAGSTRLVKTSRRSISPHTEHTKVWCSKPEIGIVSSTATCSKRISAPHDKHRIALLTSNDGWSPSAVMGTFEMHRCKINRTVIQFAYPLDASTRLLFAMSVWSLGARAQAAVAATRARAVARLVRSRPLDRSTTTVPYLFC